MAFLPIKQRGCLKYLTPTCPSPKGVFRFCHICYMYPRNLRQSMFHFFHLPSLPHLYMYIYIYSCSIYLHVSHKCCISSHTSPRYQCPSSFGLACCIHQEWKGCYFKCWNLISTWVGERKFPRFASWKFVHWQSHVKNVVGAKEFPTNSVSQR